MTTCRPDSAIELSIVMPCLKEAHTLAVRMKKAWWALYDSGISGEIIIADNGCSEDSPAIASALGARVIWAKACCDSAGRPRPRLVQQPVDAVGEESGPPSPDRLLRHAHLACDARAALAGCATQNHACVPGQPLRGGGPPRPAFERVAFLGGERQWRNRATRAHRHSFFITENRQRAQVVSIISGSGPR